MHDLIPRHLEFVDAKLFSRPSGRNVIFNCLQRPNQVLSVWQKLSLWCAASYKKFDWSFVCLYCCTVHFEDSPSIIHQQMH